MMRLILAPKSTQGIAEKTPATSWMKNQAKILQKSKKEK
jgi:hypothetical protein